MKTLPLKAENLMDFWRFLASSYEGAYFGVRNRVRFCQKLKRSQNCVANLAFEITLLQAIMLTLLLVCAFSPRVHSFPRGPRIFARNDVKRVARNKKPTKKHPLGCLNINSLPKRQNFDENNLSQNGENLMDFWCFFRGSENPRVRGAHCTFEITLLQAIMLTLLLVCAFSPKVQSIFWGPHNGQCLAMTLSASHGWQKQR